jgi:thiol-disulfide isomerase/thioredoxin
MIKALFIPFLRTISIICVLASRVGLCEAQTITGNFSLLSRQSISLEGFSGLNTYPISTTVTDASGNFTLRYNKQDYGVGYLKSADAKPVFVLLTGEDIVISGELMFSPDQVTIIKGQENRFFEQYAREQPKREQALSAWAYLEKIYQLDSLFSTQDIPIKAILAEKQRLKTEEQAFLQALPSDSYVKWFLPIRKLVSSVSVIAQYRTDELPETIAAFRSLDYSDKRLYKSGLFKDAIEGHFWLLENSGKPLDSVFLEMQVSIDSLFIHLIKDEKILNELSDYLFDLLERHSLFQASEYLALKILNEVSCTVDQNLSKQLETYRAMKKGNIAPDIVFNGENYAAGKDKKDLPSTLSQMNNKYTVVVFGASWCPKCMQELPEINSLYAKWKKNGVEVVLISLDMEKEAYKQFVKPFSFLSTCDYRKWDSPIVRDYYVFGTPTMYLLNDKREILLRPNSVKQMDAWVDWYLVQGNMSK